MRDDLHVLAQPARVAVVAVLREPCRTREAVFHDGSFFDLQLVSEPDATDIVAFRFVVADAGAAFGARAERHGTHKGAHPRWQ